jgi:hypothetical protein
MDLLLLILAQRGLQHLALAHTLRTAERRAEEDQACCRLEDAMPSRRIVVSLYECLRHSVS